MQCSCCGGELKPLDAPYCGGCYQAMSKLAEAIKAIAKGEPQYAADRARDAQEWLSLAAQRKRQTLDSPSAKE